MEISIASQGMYTETGQVAEVTFVTRLRNIFHHNSTFIVYPSLLEPKISEPQHG